MSPIHDAVHNLPDYVVQILPAIHALSGCDTTSKVGTKQQAYKAALKPEYAGLNLFGIAPLDKKMYELAEHFLLECVTRSENRKEDTFDELRYTTYHSLNHKLDLQKFPCTSSTIKIHILRAYYQCRLWIIAPMMKACDLEAIYYGYRVNEEGLLVPIVVDDECIPEGFPTPCQCGKCAKPNVCICRVNGIECCDFCKCRTQCRNPKNMKACATTVDTPMDPNKSKRKRKGKERK